MAYTINKTDGTVVATVADGQVDQLSTSLTLIGKNYSGFGTYLNDNLVSLLENFANTSKPAHPIKGQIWFDTSEGKLKVYTGTQFVPVSSATVSSTQPTTLGVGDLWFNDVDKQLFFFDGTSTILLAPAYSVSQGVSGFQVSSILDTLNQTRVVTTLYNNGILLGIFSKDSFTPKNAIAGFAGSITPGFNAGTLAGLKFNVTATNSENLNAVPAANYVRTDTANNMQGQLKITTDLGIIIGSAGQATLRVTSGDVIIANTASNKDFYVNVRKDITPETAIKVTSNTRTIDLYPNQATSQINVGGSVSITGDLTVNGTTTTLNTADVVVEDKNIILAKATGITPSETLAAGGGIILQGGNRHVFLWSNVTQNATSDSAEAQADGYSDSTPKLSSSAWTSSDHINLVSGKYFAIDGIPVITGNSLGAGITSIPGVTSFGTQSVVNIGPTPSSPYIRLENNRISTLDTNQDLELFPNGTGNVALQGSPRITGMADPLANQDAATKEYVDYTIQTRPLVFSIDLSDAKDSTYITTNILDNMAPASEYRNGTVARILCNILSVSSTILDLNPLINQSTSIFNSPSGTAPAVTNVAINTATVSPGSISTTRIIKTYQIIAGLWVFVSDTVLPA
jgi:hypothetical protein